MKLLIPGIASLVCALVLGACAEPTAPDYSKTPLLGAASANSQSGSTENSNAEESCTFSRGTTTCVTTVQFTETRTWSVYSGCVAGPTGQPGRRVTTYEGTYLVTQTTTQLRHGKSGKVYSTTVTRSETLLTSRQVSTVCEPI